MTTLQREPDEPNLTNAWLRNTERPIRELQATRIDRLVVLGAMIAATLLGGYSLGRPSLWFDEGASLALAEMPFSEFLRLTADTEANGSVYYLLLRAWAPLGQSEWWLRLPSLVFAIATIPVTFLLLRELIGRRAARLGVVLLAANAMLLEWGREIRGYSLALFLSALMGYALVRAVRGDSRRWWAFWVLASALSVAAHLISLFVIVAQALALSLLRLPFRGRIDALAAVGAAGVLSAPLVWFGLTSGEQIQWIAPLGRWQVEGFARMITGASMNRFVLPAAILVLIGAAVLMKEWTKWPANFERWGGYLLVAWFSVPFVLLVAVSALVQPMFVPRYLIMLLPAYVGLLAVGLERFHRWPLIELLLFVVVIGLGAQSILGLYDDQGKQDLRQAISIVEAGWEDGDALAGEAGLGLGAFEFYVSRGALANQLPVPMYGGVGAHDYQGNPQILDFQVTTTASAIPAERLWLTIGPSDFPTRTADAIEMQGLAPEWRQIGSWRVQGRVLLLLERA